MGGVHCSHLMSDVNYLIVGDRATDKYRFSVRERADMNFISPAAITQVYEAWMGGADADTEALDLQNLLLGVFERLVICVSRVDEDKPAILAQLARHGAKVTDSLTMGNSCVVTSSREGKRYEKAVEWKIPVLDPSWVADSLKRGAMLAMDTYDVSKVAPEDIGKDACKVWAELALQTSNAPKRRAEIDRGENAMPAINKRFKTAAPNIWGSIMDTAVRASVPKPANTSAWDVPVSRLESPRKVRRDASMDVDHNADHDADLDVSPGPSDPPNIFTNAAFSVYGFEPHQEQTLSKVIRSHDGTVVSLSDLLPQRSFNPLASEYDREPPTIDYLLIPTSLNYRKLPHDIKGLLNQGKLLGQHPIELVTEWFIERSLHYGALRLDKWGRPLKHIQTPAGPKAYRVCISGFSGIELLHIERLVRIAGCEFCEALTESRDLLIINISIITTLRQQSPELYQYTRFPEVVECGEVFGNSSKNSIRNKITAAKRWKIPIVSVAYLWDLVETGKLPPLMNLNWCIFAPEHYKQPRNLMEYMKILSNKIVSASPPGESQESDSESLREASVTETRGSEMEQDEGISQIQRIQDGGEDENEEIQVLENEEIQGREENEEIQGLEDEEIHGFEEIQGNQRIIENTDSEGMKEIESIPKIQQSQHIQQLQLIIPPDSPPVEVAAQSTLQKSAQPSQIRSKRNWGRIIGRAAESVSAPTNGSHNVALEEIESFTASNIVGNVNTAPVPIATQISYESAPIMSVDHQPGVRTAANPTAGKVRVTRAGAKAFEDMAR
ncbi:hypothetical protein BABINDRAFT_159356 [Babjeviella inositovora NRRL Y-12698]|uniref:BRCT domain-containing protein n=1 Tax=Babjeviella inositovora NRRL Y-12698 TaxID=984486 RepID=A0A1E3QYZ7_9ASCO|nr:uncharacterized protein BABINDRAFT_159356 [Babjeviella inositovora NRRL Y-12698]ODQ82858.1 hypothetical protein BABINDRAFT_159356 [Babjeviella inositovora NRRL Y-12698]